MKPISSSLLLAVASLFCAAPLLAATTIPPGHPHLQYTGRIDASTSGAPVLSFPNTAIAGQFTGTSLAVKLDDQHGKNFYNVFLDGDLARPTIIQADKGSKTYLVANGLKPGKHRFLITKRTEGEEGATVFQGLELDDKAGLLPPPPRPARRIEFYGDSITSGMGNEAPDDGVDHLGKDKNSFRSYAALSARQLGAEGHFISQSGIGVMISWFPFTMPDFYDQANAVGNNDSKWDFGKWTPDVVVINLMQNDSWLIGRDHKLQPEPDGAQRIAAYRGFIQRLRALYPKAYIVCALGSMDATKAGSPWPGYVSAAVRGMQQDGDKRIDTLFFPFAGYGAHPRVHHHEANAKLLTAFIRRKMGW
ncbi:GDSL-type esterase/lipase family protein [Massilia sp. ST3]|uniref:GDSL-type esterase/lipase family protein n=1 Tax=Massilia sp. ST3 TaxID=2824903 RepID=UPI001B831D1A|nr:GDSL-type esterase/lipase family protein [Massilia sp. ST3]MBQ5945957.1 electron transporter RnfD [Massilia sp. ST3]